MEFLPPVSPREAHQHQLDADALLLVTAPGQRSVASLKLFDYIGAGVPILALAEGNAAAEIVQDYRLGLTAPPDDPAAIATALDELLDGWQAAGARAGTCGRAPDLRRGAEALRLAATWPGSWPPFSTVWWRPDETGDHHRLVEHRRAAA